MQHAAFGNQFMGTHGLFVCIGTFRRRDACKWSTKLSTILDAWHHTNLNDQEGLDPQIQALPALFCT